MHIALDIFCFSVPFRMMFVAVFSIDTGVGGGEWPIYDMEVRMDVDFWPVSNNPTNYNSVADAMKVLIILHSICTGPFSGAIYFIDV